MQGFDYARAQRDLEIPSEFKVEAIIALGRPGSKEALPPELQQREAPSDRRPLYGTVAEGKFTASLVHLQRR